MARVTWLQRRSTLIGLLVVFVACAVAIIVGQAGTHATYASFVANGCVQNRFHVPCGNFENWFADNTDLFLRDGHRPTCGSGRDRSLCRGAAVVARARVRDLPLHLDPGASAVPAPS